MSKSIGPILRKYWKLLENKPMGPRLFSYMVGFMAPYSGTIGARVVKLEPGHGIVVLKDRRRVRNHLKCVHAMALINLAEISTGLTLMNSLPNDARGILTDIRMQYHKKARGYLTAECICVIPESNAEQELEITGEIKNEAGEVVATGIATWLIGPEKKL